MPTYKTPARRVAVQERPIENIAPSDEELFLADAENDLAGVTEEVHEPDPEAAAGIDRRHGVRTTRTGAGHRTLFAPLPDGLPRHFPVSNLRMMMSLGYTVDCPSCHTMSCDGIGCTGRPARNWTVCPHPACNDGSPKIFRDNPPVQGQRLDMADDGLRVNFGNESTPESRLRDAVRNHVYWVHHEESGSLGFGTAPSRTIDPTARQGG